MFAMHYMYTHKAHTGSVLVLIPSIKYFKKNIVLVCIWRCYTCTIRSTDRIPQDWQSKKISLERSVPKELSVKERDIAFQFVYIHLMFQRSTQS